MSEILVDIELALEHAKGDDVDDCSKILLFLDQNPDQTNEFLGRIDPNIHSKLGVTAALRYTHHKRNVHQNWKNLINIAWNAYIDDRERPDYFRGLIHFVDKP